MHRRGGGLGVIAAAAVGIFALGFVAGTALRRPASAPARPALAALGASEPAARAATNPQTYNAQFAYAAEVVRVIDGDTFEARVHVWPGLDVTTKVRLRNIDAPELHARCADESIKAQAARTALEQMLAAGGVTLSRVGIDNMAGGSTRWLLPAMRRICRRRSSAAALRARTTAAAAAAGVDYSTTTRVPTVTRSNRSWMSSLYMRIQPYDTKWPIELG